MKLLVHAVLSVARAATLFPSPIPVLEISVLVLSLWPSCIDETSNTALLLSSVTELVMMSKAQGSKRPPLCRFCFSDSKPY